MQKNQILHLSKISFLHIDVHTTKCLHMCGIVSTFSTIQNSYYFRRRCLHFSSFSLVLAPHSFRESIFLLWQHKVKPDNVTVVKDDL